MSFFGTKDYALEVARGNISGVSAVNKFGHNGALGATTTEDIHDGAAQPWVPPTTARLHDIVSSDAADDGAPVGLGARTIRVFGLTGWGTAEVSEDIIMNGVTTVPTVNAYVIIHRLEVLTSGATSINVGTITATAQTDATVTAQIAIGAGQSRMCIYGVPSTQRLFMTLFEGSVDATGPTADIVIVLNVNTNPDVQSPNFLQRHRTAINGAASSNVEHPFNPYLEIPGPAIVKLSAFASIASSVNAGFDAYLVNN